MVLVFFVFPNLVYLFLSKVTFSFYLLFLFKIFFILYTNRIHLSLNNYKLTQNEKKTSGTFLFVYM